MAAREENTVFAFAGKTDLAQAKLGAKTLAASDEFFAVKENLLLAGRGEFNAGQFGDRGQIYSGWETRRNRTPGHVNDWCIIKLCGTGIIYGIDIDTNHFLGNQPPYASVDACFAGGAKDAADLSNLKWCNVLEKSPIRPGARNLFAIKDSNKWTHVRLNIFPDGGVARLRVYGDVAPDWSGQGAGELVDLASVLNGAQGTCASDMFYSDINNMLSPGRGVNMGDGWETRRRRGPGNEWAVIKLGSPGRVRKVAIDTAHFKGNFPDRASLDGIFAPGQPIDALTVEKFKWQKVLPEIKLGPDSQHEFEKDVKEMLCSHVRLNIFPCGGVSRLRVFGFREE